MSERLEIKAFTVALPDIKEDSIPDDIQWMPPGEHSICPSVEDGSDPTEFKVAVNAELVPLLVESLNEVRAEGGEPYIDFNHNSDNGASGWVESLYWGGDDPTTGGIRAKIKWSEEGRKALAGKKFKRFSPRFFVGKDKKIIATGTNAGGLVNEPAFKKITPIVAKSGGEGGDTNKPKPQQGMTEEEKKEMDALKAENAQMKDELDKAKKEAKAAQDKNEEHEKQAKAAKEARGAELLDQAIECGIVEPKNEDKKKEFLAMATSYPQGAVLAINAAASAKKQLEERTSPQGKDNDGKPDEDAEFKIASAYQAKHGVTYVEAWRATSKEREKAVAVA